MLLMMAGGLKAVSNALPDSTLWKALAWNQTHVQWLGCTLHDLIQPSFTFLVGVVLPFSIASRTARGQSHRQMTLHAFGRALILILLGVFLRSVDKPILNWTFEDTLTQIGLGYGVLFLLGFRPHRDQWIALGTILIGYWAAFALYPLPGAGFDYARVGVNEAWQQQHLMEGFSAHWNKNSNLAWAFDTWWLNVFPREEAFAYNGGGYATLSFIPTLGTMVLGLIAGGVLKSDRAAQAKLKWFIIAGVSFLMAGWLLGVTGICPVVKRIWTPSWTLFSGGWCFLLLGGFFAVMDLWQKRSWAFPLIVIGMNSIAAYVMAGLFDDFIASMLKTILGQDFFQFLGKPYEPLLHDTATLLMLWLILFWMYRRKLFLRI